MKMFLSGQGDWQINLRTQIGCELQFRVRGDSACRSGIYLHYHMVLRHKGTSHNKFPSLVCGWGWRVSAGFLTYFADALQGHHLLWGFSIKGFKWTWQSSGQWNSHASHLAWVCVKVWSHWWWSTWIPSLWTQKTLTACYHFFFSCSVTLIILFMQKTLQLPLLTLVPQNSSISICPRSGRDACTFFAFLFCVFSWQNNLPDFLKVMWAKFFLAHFLRLFSVRSALQRSIFSLCLVASQPNPTHSLKNSGRCSWSLKLHESAQNLGSRKAHATVQNQNDTRPRNLKSSELATCGIEKYSFNCGISTWNLPFQNQTDQDHDCLKTHCEIQRMFVQSRNVNGCLSSKARNSSNLLLPGRIILWPASQQPESGQCCLSRFLWKLQ